MSKDVQKKHKSKKKSDKRSVQDVPASISTSPDQAVADMDVDDAPAEKPSKKKSKKRSEPDQDHTVDDTPAEKPAKKKSRKQSETDEERTERKRRKREQKSQAAADPVAAQTQQQQQQQSPSATQPQSDAYTESAQLSALPQADITAYLSSHSIAISNPRAPDLRPITAFAHLPPRSNSAVTGAFKAPTPIQAAAWPYAFAGRDVVGVAETGSGKTLAFGLPCARLLQARGGARPAKKKAAVQALVVSPTRELALQIHEQFARLAEAGGLRSACVYGGVPKDEQRRALAGANVLIATPGRLHDFVEDGSIDLGGVVYAVLDEADRMLDKGFEEDIKKILSQIPKPRQVLMFTATWPPSIRELAATFMTDPVKITIGGEGSGELRASANITQTVEVVDVRHKQTRLLQLLTTHSRGPKCNDRILVFCLYKKEAARVEDLIRAKGFRVAGIHGDMAQAAREKSLDAFKSGRVPVLVATDVAARGIDIPDVSLVLNNTFPLTAEDYVHRIGRTGRAGQKGAAITLFTEHDKGLSGALINVLKATKQDVPDALLAFGGTVKKKQHGVYGAFYRDNDDGAKSTKITFD